MNHTHLRLPAHAAPVLLVAALVASLLLAVPAAAQSTYINVRTLGANTFVDAGVAVSQAAFSPDTTDAVVLATSANFPDGLAASAVAGSLGAPILFTAPDMLSAPTAAEIDRLLEPGDTVVIMGGTVAISDAIEQQLAADYTVQRLAGESRLETAILAADLVGVPDSGQVIVARAFGPDGANTESDRTTGWVDAVSCGAFAAASGTPIYLTQTDVLSTSTRDALASIGADEAIVCGGDAAVGPAARDGIEALGIDVTVVSGPTRVETAIASATDLFGFDTARGHAFTVVPGFGPNFGYGLAGAVIGNPILLVDTNLPTDCADTTQTAFPTLCYLQSGDQDTVAEIVIIGDSTLISDAVANAVGEAAGGLDLNDIEVLPAPTGVTAEDDIDDDGTRLTVEWNAVEESQDVLAGYNVYVGDTAQLAQAEPMTTVDADTTTYVVEGLTAGQEVSVTVTSVDIGGRESEPSEAATATPADEVPAPVSNFEAEARDMGAVLTWDIGPPDTASYTIRRATVDAMGNCPDSGYAIVGQPITDRQTTTFTDSGLTNGTAYCYQHTVTDTGGQVSQPADAGPITPQPPQLGISAEGIDEEMELHTGFPYELALTTTLDQDTSVDELELLVELVFEDGAIAPIQFFDDPHPQMLEHTVTVQVPDVAEYDGEVANILISLFKEGGDQVDETIADVEINRSPEIVFGLSAVGGNGSVQLSWDKSPELTTSGYVIQRAVVQVNEQNDTAAACETPFASFEDYRTVTSVNDTMETDPDVNNGNQLFDNRYCYRVIATRPAMSGLAAGDQRSSAAESIIDSANPDISAADITLNSPASGTVRERRDTTVTWTITVPEGGTATTETTLDYCVDFSQGITNTEPVCQAPGWQPMDLNGGTAGNGQPVSSAVTGGNEMTFNATWSVPNIAQDPDETGAVRATTNGNRRDVNPGISFR